MKNLFLITSLLLWGALSISAQHFQGSWTKVNTTYVFNFDLHLDVNESDEVVGYFIWKLVRYDENNSLSKKHYEKKIGLTAKEYVTGTFHPDTGEYSLKGTNKDDRHMIIGMDTYNLKVDENGILEGQTNANGTWLGRIKGRKNQIDF